MVGINQTAERTERFVRELSAVICYNHFNSPTFFSFSVSKRRMIHKAEALM